MKKRIQCLLKDARLEGLMVTREFADAPFRLTIMLKDLEAGKELSFEQNSYLQSLECHIRIIHPHLETLTVNGEDVPVLFITEPVSPIGGKP